MQLFNDASGYALEEGLVKGITLNSLVTSFRDVVSRGELPKTLVFHRPLDVQPYRGEKAESYLKVALQHGVNPHYFANVLHQNTLRNFFSRFHIVVAYHDKGPFVQLSARHKDTFRKRNPKIEREIDATNRLFGRDLGLEPTDHEWEKRRFKAGHLEERIYTADLEENDLDNMDFGRIGSRCDIHELSLGNGEEYEIPYFSGSNGYARCSSMSASIHPFTDLTRDGKVDKWSFTVHSGYACEEDKSCTIEEERVDFVNTMLENMVEYAVPDTCVVMGDDYSGGDFQLVTPETHFDEIVLNLTGRSSWREVGMGTIADSTTRLAGFYEGLQKVPDFGPQYAERLLDTMERVYGELPDDNEGKSLLGFTLEKIKGE